jgi:MOSC domain-containing protein YiiM
VIDQAPDTSGGLPRLLEDLDREIGRILEVVRDIGDDDAAGWDRPLSFAGYEVDARWILRHTVHEATHHLGDAGRVLHLLGAGAPTQQGTVARLSAGDGGVPKRAVDLAEVGDRGLVGDRQADRNNHGRPLQALCIWSLEVIQALQEEGHPIRPGDAGENITIAGIDWTTLRTGVQLLIGDVLAEVSAFATPCSKNAPWFTDRYFNRMDHGRHPGWSRVYAWVREPGTIRTGDPVIIEP